jgi:hypothetical protein
VRERPFVFYETYYFANIIKNVLEERFAFLRNLHDLSPLFRGERKRIEAVVPERIQDCVHAINMALDDLDDSRRVVGLLGAGLVFAHHE